MKPVVSALNAWSWYVSPQFQSSLVIPNLLIVDSVIISLFAIVILSVLGSLYGSNSPSFTGSEGEPEDGPAVAASIYTAVIVYVVSQSPSRHPMGSTQQKNQALTVHSFVHQGFFVFCGLQAYLHMRDSRGGAISLH
ncbi:hypothetical protein N7541_007720 [Penicillium brevicompactum]|uniref:Uncharacterized protein n=1 Tax=Penicillium brevicompactum TaxID=5074 RepID=A0A9W9R3D1_PENBR|nr:hypothetical protein N7541_007720 [Penicillium brevicompactum]